MMNNIFNKHKIEYYGAISLSHTHIINQSLFERKTPFAKSIIMFLIPYYAGETKDRNISLYAVAPDYHTYLERLSEEICAELKGIYPENTFYGMGDHSPIAETHAAAVCGLGLIGDNYRLINEKYGSYVFIGEIFTDLEFDGEPKEIKTCLHCGLCKKACPSPNDCLSGITQKKGELTEDEQKLMIDNNTAWGCDICQLVCPLNKDKAETNIDFFRENLIYTLTPEILSNMTDEELKSRAFGWRKRKTIERNINILFNK